ncbi:MAG TPA: UbiA family prenyltransferase [Pseudonocardiaceae bacterium]|nr:UbiA family prenyltransferase [Pseudonocardiaceae bacterium]
MTSETERRGAVTVPGAKVHAYARLAKLDIFDYYLGLLVVWSLLPAPSRLDARSLLTLAAFLVAEACICAAAVAFDDVTGYRDGSDAANYGPDAPARKLRRKPLLTGALSPPEAIRFGWAMVVLAALACTVSVVIAPHHPNWAIAVTALCAVAFIQYSWGAKLSYHGWAEVVLAGTAFGWLLAPYGLLTGTASGFVAVQAFVFGLGPLLFGVYSNTNDRVADAAVGRRTAATVLSPRGNAIFIGAVSLAETLIIVGSAALGVAPWWFPLVMLPTIALRAVQYHTGFRRGDILRARWLGIRAHRMTVVLLVAVNLVVGLGAL